MTAESESPRPYLPFGVPRFGAVNWLGVWTLYVKEVRRFLKVWMQTVLAPVASTLVYLSIFTVALGANRPTVGDVPFAEFLAPGLVMMAVITNAFANTSSSMLISKVQGNIVDMLMPPLTPVETACAVVLGGITRGIVVAVVTLGVMSFFVPVSVQHWWAVVVFLLGASTILSSVGAIAGIWADKFDHMASVTNFVILPLSFLSGTFYSIRLLPESFQAFSRMNPFFYMIDGWRYGFIGYADSSLITGSVIVLGLAAVTFIVCLALLARGYKLKT